MTEKIATMLHISDLHLVENLGEKGKTNSFGGGSFLVNSHSFEKLNKFHDKLLDFEREEKKIDIVLATGDITTDGTKAALETARKYFEQDQVRDEYDRLIIDGLGLSAAQRLVVPGNHDRYNGKFLTRQTQNTNLEEIFEIEQRDFYVVGYRPAQVGSFAPVPTILFFVFDSTPPGHVLRNMITGRTAQGFISPGILRNFWREAKRLVTEKKVRGFDGNFFDFEPENSIRIAVLHHHPVAKQKRSVWEKVKSKVVKPKWTQIINSREFRQYCFLVGIHLVLFGHEHENYIFEEPFPVSLNSLEKPADTPFGRPHNIVYLCCPSTSEYKSNKNGFFIIDFYKNKEVKIKLYEYNGDSFELEPIEDTLGNKVANASFSF